MVRLKDGFNCEGLDTNIVKQSGDPFEEAILCWANVAPESPEHWKLPSLGLLGVLRRWSFTFI